MFVELTHANTQAKISVVSNQIFAVYFSMNSKSTHVVSSAGGVVPVAETVDEVKEALQRSKDGVRTERE